MSELFVLKNSMDVFLRKILLVGILQFLSLPIFANDIVSAKNFEHLDITQAPQTRTTPAFLYSIDTKRKRIGLLTYDGITPIQADRTLGDSAKADSINYDELIISECGDKQGFLQRKGYVSFHNLTGRTGFETLDSFCHVARNYSTKWFKSDQLGFNMWYAKINLPKFFV